MILQGTSIPSSSLWARTQSGLYVPRLPQRVYHAVDLFCGCGGFSLGIEAAGVDVVAALDHWEAATITYLYNLGHRDGCAVGYIEEEAGQAKLTKALKQHARRSKSEIWSNGRWVGWNRAPGNNMGCRAFLFGDASKATGAMFRELLELKGWRGKIDLVVGGPPCQGMSTSNAKARPEDPRNNLIFEFLRLASELDAPNFIMENVPPLLTDKKFHALRNAYFKRAGEYGYDLVANIINAADYGVPQTRRRAIIIGYRPELGLPAQFPMPSHWALRVKKGEMSCNMLTHEDEDEGQDPGPGQLEMF